MEHAVELASKQASKLNLFGERGIDEESTECWMR
jgi:hypothetical protein